MRDHNPRVGLGVRSHDGQGIWPVTDEEIAVELAKPGRAEVLRLRLSDISQFMRKQRQTG